MSSVNVDEHAKFTPTRHPKDCCNCDSENWESRKMVHVQVPLLSEEAIQNGIRLKWEAEFAHVRQYFSESDFRRKIQELVEIERENPLVSHDAIEVPNLQFFNIIIDLILKLVNSVAQTSLISNSSKF